MVIKNKAEFGSLSDLWKENPFSGQVKCINSMSLLDSRQCKDLVALYELEALLRVTYVSEIFT